MLIGILQTGLAPDALAGEMGDYPDMFAQLLAGRGLTFRTFRVVEMEFPSDVHQADGWLITGSRHGAYEDLPFIKPLEDFIRKAIAEKVPLVGICFGHQIVAQALGGKVERHAGGWAVGPTEYDFGGQKLTLNAWHRDQVTELPPGAEVVACNDFCQNAALVYGDRAFTVQAHPEFRAAFVDGLMQTRGKGVVPDDLMAEATARLGTQIDDQAIADRIAAFFKQPRG
ncbi:type 1 glutamine amidotransferase [Rhodobacter ferrooxidans]|uniref:Glutamine amidotransferase class-I n=1 Tax=Rhodobacter ferrooxidans TaxID=371731 RepID=C8S108_9RHOB|nr:type 1 glutamine amidotransferase [Rhodobacter sp. SW2]EEW25449.1 glutamine amidotransferase class-I [Rhodobacter sp. SW2]